jgi:hypothetical protein
MSCEERTKDQETARLYCIQKRVRTPFTPIC